MKQIISALFLILLHTPLSAATLADADSVFAWAEINYSDLLKPSGQISQSALGYYYRYYPGSNSYVGFRADDQKIYYLPSNGSAVAVGDINVFLTQTYTPPVVPDPLLQYLRAGVYRNWAADAEPHASSGPHGKIRTYYSPILAASLSTTKNHSKGATAIKELYSSDNILSGWAVAIKTDTDSANGEGWYWYEVTSVAANSKPAVSGNGVTSCSGCHSTGKDFIRGSLP